MKPHLPKPSFTVKDGIELPLSGDALTELLGAVLEKGVPFRFMAKGFSMSPFIKNGDIVTVSPISKSGVHMGDVVAFINPHSGKLTVHRIIGKKKNDFIIQGDNVPIADGIITAAELIGVVSKVERKGKEVSLGLGPESPVVAFLTRVGILRPLRNIIWKLFHPLFRRRKR